MLKEGIDDLTRVGFNEAMRGRVEGGVVHSKGRRGQW